MMKSFRLLAWLTLAALVAAVGFQRHSILKLRHQLLSAAQPVGEGDTSTPARPSEGPPDANQDSEIERLKQDNEMLRLELARARNRATQLRQQMDDESASNVGASNLLAGVSHLVCTNSFGRTSTFSPPALREVGVGSLDDALQTSLHALFSAEPLRIETFVHPDSHLSAEGGAEILDGFRQQLRDTSEILISNQAENLDGSVDLTLEFKYPAQTEGQPPTTALVHMRPFESGYRLDRFTPVRITLAP